MFRMKTGLEMAQTDCYFEDDPEAVLCNSTFKNFGSKR